MDRLDKLKNITNNDMSDFRLTGRKIIGKIVDIYSNNIVKMVLLIDNIVLKFNCILELVDTFHEDIDKLKNLSTNISDSTSFNKLSKIDRLKLMDKNTKLLKVECDNFNLKGQLIVRLYDLDSTVSINSFLINNYDKKNFENSQQLFFNMSPN